MAENLEATIGGLRWEPRGTAWQSYYDETNYTSGGIENKLAITEGFLGQARPRTAWDLGSNTGMFSRVASRQGIYTVSIDSDSGAVELNDRAAVEEKSENLLPLLIDLTNPSPSLGWQNEERLSLRRAGPGGCRPGPGADPPPGHRQQRPAGRHRGVVQPPDALVDSRVRPQAGLAGAAPALLPGRYLRRLS